MFTESRWADSPHGLLRQTVNDILGKVGTESIEVVDCLAIS